MVNFLRPKSIPRLVLTGFLLVALPLIIALANTTISVDRLVTHGQQSLLQSVFITQGSQVLVEAIKAMERNARQYQVLGDRVLFDVYEENHLRFEDSARNLESLQLAQGQRELLEKLRGAETGLHDLLVAHSFDAPEIEAALPEFIELGRMAQQILLDNQGLITAVVERMQEESESVQRMLVLQALALAPAVLGLAAVFTVLISRPMRQIDRAIRRLGDGRFDDTPVISGPRDLQLLGERLDWLRLRLVELEQDKTRFLQHISHELKTPLTAIREGTELMREQVVGDLNESQMEIAGILHDNSLQLQKLIEDLINFSIVRSRSEAIAREPVALEAVVSEVLSDHKLTILSRRLKVRSSLQPVTLQGDREKLRILADNLVSNAIKYSPDDGTLEVRLQRDGKYAVLRVADDGPGIPEDERERVFEAFYQGSHASKGAVRGTGLGLSIAREYAQAHGGNVSVVKSAARGACLQVVLPLERTA